MNRKILLSEWQFVFPTRQPQGIQLEHIWTRVGDIFGAFDKENGIASIESSELQISSLHVW